MEHKHRGTARFSKAEQAAARNWLTRELERQRGRKLQALWEYAARGMREPLKSPEVEAKRLQAAIARLREIAATRH